MTIGLFFMFCICLGLGYGVVSALLGGHGGDGDIQLDADGHLDAGQVSPVSGPVIAMFVTGFGAGGIVAQKGFDVSSGPAVVVATLTGLVLAALVFGFLSLVLHHTQAGTEYTAEEVAGLTAEVITTIPAGGTGEIAYVVKGQRERAAARAGEAEGVAKGSQVLIERMVGSIAHVRLPD